MKLFSVPDTFWKSGKCIIALFLFFFLFSPYAYAQRKGYGVEVRLVAPPLFETRPGEIISVSFVVRNISDRRETFEEALSLPEGWLLIIPPDLFTLNQGEETVRAMAFQVPHAASAGQYTVAYSVRSRQDYSIGDRTDFDVAVLPVNEIKLLLENAPDTLIGGETYQITARLVNGGNSPVTATLSARSTKGYTLSVSPEELTLDPGAISPIGVSVETDPKTPKSFKHIVILEASSKDKPHIRTSLSVGTEILAREAEADLYHRVPATLTLRAMGKRNSGNSNGFGIELKGKGTLDEEGRRRVEFLLRGPDTQDKGLFGERDEYYMNYHDPDLNVRLGDQSYGLSYLTSYGRYGRGFETKYHPEGKNLGFGAYYLKNRFGIPGWEEKGAYLCALSSRRAKWKLNYLTKERESYNSTPRTEDVIGSIEGEFEPAGNMKVLLEYAQGERSKKSETMDGDAYRAALYGSMGKVRYVFNKTLADPDFYGYYNDSDYMSGSVNFPLSDRMQGFLSYSAYETNLDMRPDKGNTANKEMLFRTGVNYTLSHGWYTQLGFDNFHRKDRLTPAKYNIKEEAYRLSFGRSAGNFNYRIEARYADQYDNVEGRSASPWNYSFYVSCISSRTLYFTLYGGFGDNGALKGSRILSDQDTLGISFNWQASNRLTFRGWYTKYNFNSKNPKSDNYQIELRYMMPDESCWTLKARRYDWEYGEQIQTDYVLAYSMPIGIPVGKKKSLGVVSGRIFDAQTSGKAPFPGAIVTLNGTKTAVDESGRFSFSAPPGTHIMDIDRTSIGLKNTATTKLPLKVTVEPSKTTLVKLNIVESATLGGQVILANDEPEEHFGKDGPVVIGALEKGSVNHDRALEGILVELSRDDEILRTLTDNEGKFVFAGIRPGPWKFKTYDYKLPPYHYIKTPEMDLTLSSGDREDITVKVLAKKRRIQILEEDIIRSR